MAQAGPGLVGYAAFGAFYKQAHNPGDLQGAHTTVQVPPIGHNATGIHLIPPGPNATQVGIRCRGIPWGIMEKTNNRLSSRNGTCTMDAVLVICKLIKAWQPLPNRPTRDTLHSNAFTVLEMMNHGAQPVMAEGAIVPWVNDHHNWDTIDKRGLLLKKNEVWHSFIALYRDRVRTMIRGVNALDTWRCGLHMEPKTTLKSSDCFYCQPCHLWFPGNIPLSQGDTSIIVGQHTSVALGTAGARPIESMVEGWFRNLALPNLPGAAAAAAAAVQCASCNGAVHGGRVVVGRLPEYVTVGLARQASAAAVATAGHDLNVEIPMQQSNGQFRRRGQTLHWMGGIYRHNRHVRVFWRDEGNAPTLSVYDGLEPARSANGAHSCDGPVFTGFPAFNAPAQRVPPPYGNQPLLLVYRRGAVKSLSAISVERRTRTNNAQQAAAGNSQQGGGSAQQSGAENAQQGGGSAQQASAGNSQQAGGGGAQQGGGGDAQQAGGSSSQRAGGRNSRRAGAGNSQRTSTDGTQQPSTSNIQKTTTIRRSKRIENAAKRKRTDPEPAPRLPPAKRKKLTRAEVDREHQKLIDGFLENHCCAADPPEEDPAELTLGGTQEQWERIIAHLQVHPLSMADAF